MQIHAVKSEPHFNIAAAKASPHFRGVEHLVRKARIDVDEQLTTGELDMKLKSICAVADRPHRLEGALSRAGILI